MKIIQVSHLRCSITGFAAATQVPGANLAGVFNMGGSAVASYVSILERLQ